MREVGAVADRRNRWIGREQELVDDDTIVAFEAGFPGQRVFRHDADPDHDQVSAQRFAITENDRLRVSRALDRRDADAEPKSAPKAPRCSKKNRHGRRDRPAHRARDFDHRRLRPETDSGRGDFEPDNRRR